MDIIEEVLKPILTDVWIFTPIRGDAIHEATYEELHNYLVSVLKGQVVLHDETLSLESTCTTNNECYAMYDVYMSVKYDNGSSRATPIGELLTIKCKVS